MNSAFFKLSCIACACLLVGCADGSFKVNNFDIGKSVSALKNANEASKELNQEQEIQLGQGIASNLFGMAPLVADHEVQRYINHVGRWLSLHTERPDLPWTFAVIDSDACNAFAAPGGYIVITKGLLLRMNNEADLAGVLAHEIVHVLKKHHLNALRKSSAMSAANDLLEVGLAQKRLNSNWAKLATAGTELYTRGLDKDDEYEADQMAIVIAARAGYDPYGLPAVLQSLQSMDTHDPGMGLFLKTHPKLEDRLSQLDVLMNTGFERFDDAPNGQARFQKMLGRILFSQNKNASAK
jgi:predicted Zn-dependent protease